jgi:hypothetical protein
MKRNKAPTKKPTAAGIQGMEGYNFSDISMEGLSRDQKLAATITPPVNPNMASKRPLCMVLNKKTKAAPAAVTNHVKVVANKAAQTGCRFSKKLSKEFTFQR